MRAVLIALVVLASGAAWAKEITPEFNWRMQQFMDCAEAKIQNYKTSPDSSEAIVSAILTTCEHERESLIEIAIKLREFETKQKMTASERASFSAAGEARIRDLTNARLIEVRAK